MKKLLLIAAIAVVGMTGAQAQDINFGVKAGVNFASIGGDETDNVDTKTGFHAGVLAEFMISEQFGIQPELLYSMQGAKREENQSQTQMGITAKYSASSELKLDYITLPVLAKYYITDGFSVHLGPKVGYLLSAKNEYDSSTSIDGEVIESDSGEDDIKDNLSSIDFGLVGGLEYDLDMGVFFQARYSLGLSNINDSDNFKNQNNIIQLSVGYKF